jgi:nitrogen fixation NifU-like protein
VTDASFQGIGCAISTASASMLTETLKGKSEKEAYELFDEFHKLVTSASEEERPCNDCLGKLMVFSGIREFPMRVKCAILCWHAMKAALDGADDSVTTE